MKYEYNVPPTRGGGPPIGFWEFSTVAQEDSFTPLLEITGNSTRALNSHGQPTVQFSQISVQGYMNADSGAHASSVIRMNLTVVIANNRRTNYTSTSDSTARSTAYTSVVDYFNEVLPRRWNF